MAETKDEIPTAPECPPPPLPADTMEEQNEPQQQAPEAKCDAQNELVTQQITEAINNDKANEDPTSDMADANKIDELSVTGNDENTVENLNNPVANDEITKDEIDKDVAPAIEIKITEEEQSIYKQIQTEKEAITKCTDRVVESLNEFETNSEQKTNAINDTFDELIKELNDRKTALLNELNNQILTQKANALEQIESMKQYQQTLSSMDAKYQSLTDPNTNGDDDEKVDSEQRKKEILQMKEQFDSEYSSMEFAVDIKLVLNSNELESTIRNFGLVLVGKAGDLDYDSSIVPSFIDTNLDILLGQVAVKRLYRWIKKPGHESTFQPRVHRSIISFYQNKKSYKVRMVVLEKESESDSFLMNQWVSRKELVEKEKLVWIWSGFDASIASEERDENKGYTKWCGMFYDDKDFEKFATQFNQARKINIQALKNEEQLSKNKRRKERLEKIALKGTDAYDDDDDDDYYENDEKLCFEMNIWKAYLWGKDAAEKDAWIPYANKSLLRFLQNRNKRKVRIVLIESGSNEVKLNHWIPYDVTLKSRGDQMWEWQAYDELTKTFLKRSTLKLATICGTFIDKKDTEKFKLLFEKYQKINRKADAI